MSNRNKLLITFQELKDNSKIEGNITETLLRPIILLAQEVDLQTIIGESMFEFLLSARVTSGNAGWTSAVSGNTTWMTFIDDYMKPCMYAYSTMEFLDSNSVHLSEIGITVTTGSESAPAGDRELAHQRAQAKGRADFYANRLRKFICDERYWATFADYFDNSQQNLYPEERINRSGFWFPRTGTNYSNFKKYDI